VLLVSTRLHSIIGKLRNTLDAIAPMANNTLFRRSAPYKSIWLAAPSNPANLRGIFFYFQLSLQPFSFVV
ncbi:MAG: hypothetical protein J6Q06_00385, partial [Clostridia bacterium]|nr:hypothetical protein [Clostridia bacterium]